MNLYNIFEFQFLPVKWVYRFTLNAEYTTLVKDNKSIENKESTQGPRC